MAGRLLVKVTNDEIAKDLASKLILFPELPWILVNRIALQFRQLGRTTAFGGSGPDTLGEADPWGKAGRSRYKGFAREKSFIYSTKQTKKNAIAKMGSPLANIWESDPKKRKIKRKIMFLTTFSKQFQQMGIADKIIEAALENIAKTGKP